MFITFHLVALTWIFFRSPSIGEAWQFLGGILSVSGGLQTFGLAKLVMAMSLLALIDIPQYRSGSHTVFLTWPWPVRAVFYAGLFFLLCMFRSDGDIPFIYFQF